MSIFSNDDSPPSSSLTTDFSTESSSRNVDSELQNFLMVEKQKAELNAQIHEFNDFCWEKCTPQKLGTKLDGKTETCLTNCVDRFIDVSIFITNRFAMSLQKSAKM